MISFLKLVFIEDGTIQYLDSAFDNWTACMNFLNSVVYPAIIKHGVPLLQGYCT